MKTFYSALSTIYQWLMLFSIGYFAKTIPNEDGKPLLILLFILALPYNVIKLTKPNSDLLQIIKYMCLVALSVFVFLIAVVSFLATTNVFLLDAILIIYTISCAYEMNDEIFT